MPPQNSFRYDPNLRGTDRRYDEREGWFGRQQRPGGDIELKPETPDTDLQAALQALEAQRPNLSGAGPMPPSPPPMMGTRDTSVVYGSGDDDLGLDTMPSPFAGVTRQNAMQGLEGLRAAQSNQFSPFGEHELSRLASRDPNTVAPGSNAMWAGKLQEMRGNRLESEGIQRKALAGIQGAIQGTHPAVQFGLEQDARRKAMPSMITAQGQFRAAQEAANARRDVGEAQLEGRTITAQHNTLDTVMNAIRAMRAKAGGLTGDDTVQLRALENLYDLLSENLTGATFDEATEGFEE